MTSSDDEREAVRRVKAGDADAFGVLVRLHSRSLHRLASRVLAGGEGADDVVQETFLRAFRTFDRFDDSAPLAPWLHRIAANAAIDQLRRSRREVALGFDDSDEGARELSPPDGAPPPDRRAGSAEIARAARRALAGLSATERAAFLLRHCDGHSIAEISRVLGKGDNATKQSIFRAVRKLRRALAPWTEVTREELA
jgi:RNA polymerase sigma-70 factor (ECF subfamily)